MGTLTEAASVSEAAELPLEKGEGWVDAVFRFFCSLKLTLTNKAPATDSPYILGADPAVASGLICFEIWTWFAPMRGF